MLILLHELPILQPLPLLIPPHPRFIKLPFAPRPDVADARHGFQRRLDEIAVVARGDIAALGELQGRVDHHLFAVRAAEGFCPPEFARVALHFEVFVAGMYVLA